MTSTSSRVAASWGQAARLSQAPGTSEPLVPTEGVVSAGSRELWFVTAGGSPAVLAIPAGEPPAVTNHSSLALALDGHNLFSPRPPGARGEKRKRTPAACVAARRTTNGNQARHPRFPQRGHRPR